jgi:L-ascorbate metabolism protein UlaG (beta-lactamase superfamily)
MATLALVTTTTLFAATPSHPISIRFIGNAAFELTDGEAVILVDFPYQPGYSGYMTFDRSELHERRPSLCVFTHRHRDHFAAESIAAVGCTVAGPNDLLAALPEAVRAGAGPVWKFAGAEVRCIPTEHVGDHCSQLLAWHGQRLYFAGDVEELSGLDRVEGGLDMVFLPAWLASKASEVRAKRPGVRIVIQHHQSDESVQCEDCTVPRQSGAVD